MDAFRFFFEALAEEWDAQQPPNRQERLRGFLAQFDSLWREARSILDVGTGTGALLALLPECAPAARLVAVDLARAMLQRAQARMGRECPSARPLLNQADAHRLPLPAQAFDVVICHSSLPHFADKSAALCELKRVLRPGGHLIILHDVGREMVNAIHASAAEAVRGDLLPTGQEMQVLFARAGLAEIHVEDTPDHYLAVGRVPVTWSCSALQAEGLVVHYGALRALDGVSLTVESGEMMGLFGPNGAGKSTFLKAAMGLVRIDGGTLSVLDTPLFSPAYSHIRPQLGYVPQRLPNGRFPVTVWDAVAMGRYGLAGVGRSLTSQDRAFVQEALGCVGLTHLAERRVQDLSGGQTQRVGIARALAQQPQMLLLDEPTANLDRDGQLELACQVQALNRERGITVLVVSHSMDVAHLCHRLCFFEAGRVSRIEEMPNHA